MSIQDAEYWKRYREKNREKLRVEALARYHANRDKMLAASKIYYSRPDKRAARIEYLKKWRERNPDYRQKYIEANRDKINEYVKIRRQRPEVREKNVVAMRKWAIENPEKKKAGMMAWYHKNKHNPDQILKRRKHSRNHYHRDIEKNRALARASAKRNLPRIAAYQANRRKTNIQFMLAGRLRATVNRAFRRNWIEKPTRTMALIGCTIEEAKAHLEKQFVNGYSWENRNTWHIDHIVPVVAFDLTDKEEVLWAFNYRNLRPLAGHLNNSKSDTLSNPLPDWLPAHIAERILKRPNSTSQQAQPSTVQSQPVTVVPIEMAHSSCPV